MISRKNRAPTGRTSNRPSTTASGCPSARSARSSHSGLNSGRINNPDATQSIHSPIKRPSSRMSQSGARSLPPSSRSQAESARSFNFQRGDVTGRMSTDRANHSCGEMSPHYTYGDTTFKLPDDRLQNSNVASIDLTARKVLENPDTSLDDLTQLSTREILHRLRDRGKQEERAEADLKTLEMSEYNDYSRPRPSTLYPHRTAFLDPSVNNISPSKTQTELKKKIKQFSAPHPSYDIDGDGDISHEDYRLAKRFDFDGNGVIDPYERRIAKYVIADEFFSKHNEHMHVFGDEIANSSHKENVLRLSRAPNFERTLTLLKGVEGSLRGRSSKEMVNCMASVHTDAVKKNFYTNKLDTTAYTNFDAVPGTERSLDHNGSRIKLLESRKLGQKNECAERLTAAQNKAPQYSTVKLKMPFD